DFSQVEVDRQVTNLDRFELFFPERRQFFLENSDLFASLGSENIRPFFSRRIGLNNPVRAGARLSGKIGENWRIGLMNMQTGTKEDIPATNFSVAAIQRKIFNRSNIGVFMVNKQLTTDPADTTFSGPRFNRVAGMDLNLASANNRWTGKVFYHQSFSEENEGESFATSGAVEYSTQQWLVSLSQAWVGKDYLAETGFVRRRGFHQSNARVQYKYFPASKKIANHGPIASMGLFFNPQLELTDRQIDVGYQITGLDRSTVSGQVSDGFVKLQAPFDPTNTGGDSLATGSEFTWKEVSLSYASDGRKLFNFILNTRYGGYFNGTRWSVGGEVNYRVQPFGSLAMVASYNQINLPAPYTSAELILIGPRLDITMTDKIFITTFLQYNNQIDNLNLNVRFQWRFAPVSDLFIVYSNNSYTNGLGAKNRALVGKLSYWFN
ncbi:MAG: hydrolase, partial [Bacteroidetes bacterium]|nr:hydrolase [Bacteroidota bacterium]